MHASSAELWNVRSFTITSPYLPSWHSAWVRTVLCLPLHKSCRIRKGLRAVEEVECCHVMLNHIMLGSVLLEESKFKKLSCLVSLSCLKSKQIAYRVLIRKP